MISYTSAQSHSNNSPSILSHQLSPLSCKFSCFIKRLLLPPHFPSVVPHFPTQFYDKTPWKRYILSLIFLFLFFFFLFFVNLIQSVLLFLHSTKSTRQDYQVISMLLNPKMFNKPPPPKHSKRLVTFFLGPLFPVNFQDISYTLFRFPLFPLHLISDS